MEYWIREVTEVLADTEKETKKVHSSEQSNRLLHKLQPYDQQIVGIDNKLTNVEKQSSQLNCLLIN